MSKTSQPMVSICIPTYEMNGRGREFLQFSFDALARQTFVDFDVIISDHSPSGMIETLCDEYKEKLTIYYYKNTDRVGSSSANINNAIMKATGKLIKILFQDDFLFNETSLESIVNNFDMRKDHWLVTASEHSKDGITFFRPFYPYYNNQVVVGKNTISSPSAVTVKNDHPLLFDENLTWLMDCDYYRRYYDAYGEPKIVNEVTVVNRVGEHQVTNTLATESLRKREYYYIIDKYRYGLTYWWRRLRGVANHISN